MNKLSKILALVLALVLVFTCFAGCSSSNNDAKDDSASAADDANKDTADDAGDDASDDAADNGAVVAPDGATDLSFLKVGACVMSLQQEYMINLVKGYDEFVEQTGLSLTVTDGGNNEPEKQVTNCENYVQQGMDAIVVQCVSVDALADLINTAGKQGIKVAYYPQDPAVTEASAYLGYDEYDWGSKLGTNAGEWAKEHYSDTPVILNLTSSQEKNSIERCQGMKDAFAESYGSEDFEWITVEAVGAEDAMTNIESALQAHPDADMILCYNDNVSTGAYQAAIQSGLDLTDFYIGSCDGTDTVLDLMQEENSPFRCTVGNAFQVPEIGFGWIQNIVKCALGLSYDECYNVETLPINQDEVDAYRAKDMVFELDAELADYIAGLSK